MKSSDRQGFWERLSSSLERHAKPLAAFYLLAAFVGAFYSFQLYKNLRTDLEELLPASAPSVQDLKAGAQRISGTNHLEVVIETSNSKAGERFQRDLADRLRRLPPDVVAQVKEDVSEERRFFNRYRAYYVDLADLEDILGKARAKLKSETKKAFSLGIDDDDKEEESSKRLGINTRRLRAKYDSKSGTLDRFPDDYFQMNHGTTRVVIAFLPGKVTDMAGNQRLSKAAENIIHELNPRGYAPDMKVGLGGDVQNVVEENRELVKDLVKSFVICTVLVTLAVWYFFGTLSCVAALSFALFVGVCLAFGEAYFLVGYLNANTAFLGSIVIGNGINFPIIMLARYAEVRRHPGSSAGSSMALALRETWKPTLAAAGAAGVSYGSLALTDFRGFSQFGVIGALGMAMCWLSTFLVLPTILFLLEGRGWLHVGSKEREGRGPMALLAPLAVRFHKGLAAGTVLISLAAILGATQLSKRTIESDLSKLRNKESMEHGSGYWGKKTDRIFGRGLTPTVVLTDNAADSAKLYHELQLIQAREGANSPFASLSNLDDVFPPGQARKFEILNELNHLLTPKVRTELGRQEARLVRDFLPDPAPPPFQTRDLPEALLKGYEETDGRIGTVIQVYPRLNLTGTGEVAHGTWNGDEVIRYTALLREAIRQSGVHALILGQNPISADMLESVQKDGPKATLVSFLAVALLVVLLFPHWKQAGPVLFSLLLGVLWMVGAIGAFHWRINFLNFIALPITFGIGVDYSVNIFGRIYYERLRGVKTDVVQVIRETGGAVVLASGTTCIGYGSLLMSGSQAFVSFGKLAVTGEITCISAAILSLPSLWLVIQERRGRHHTAKSA